LLTVVGRLWTDQAGITAVKFQLTFLAILAMLLGTIEMGRLLIAHSTLAHAVSDEIPNSPSDIANSQGGADSATMQRISLDPHSPDHDARVRPLRLP
jgi:hypothetical protein